MSTSIKTLTLLAISMLILTSCASDDVNVKRFEAPVLEINMPRPLDLREVKWTVTENGEFILDSDNFTNLALNTEDTQNRLFLYHNIIVKQQEFYTRQSKIGIDTND